MSDLKKIIRMVPDFPKPGINFCDITPLLQDVTVLKEVADRLTEPFSDKGIDVVVGIEARGFIFGPLVAAKLGVGFVPIRKPGKLPYKTRKVSYDLEYGSDAVEIHEDAVSPGQKILIIDDLLATGGTAAAAAQLIKELKGEVAGFGFVIELNFLNGRGKLEPHFVHSLVEYDE